LSGLDVVKCQDQNGNQGESTTDDSSPTRTVIPEIVVPSFSPLTVSTGETLKRSHTRSFTSLKSDLRDAWGAVLSGQSITGCLNVCKTPSFLHGDDTDPMYYRVTAIFCITHNFLGYAPYNEVS